MQGLKTIDLFAGRIHRVILTALFAMLLCSCRKTEQPEDPRPSPDTLPTVETTNDAKVLGSTAIISATVVSVGGSVITSEGICWDTLPGPTISKSQMQANGLLRVFTIKVNGLWVGRKYYVRAFATSAAGTAYSGEITFTISDLSNSNLFIDKNFLVTSYLVDPAINGSNDVWTIRPACVKDNITRFLSNGVVAFDEGATKCDFSDPPTASGTWSLSKIENRLTIKDQHNNVTNYHLHVNDGQKLVLGHEDSGVPPHSFTVTMQKL